ncbi:hypothetical protein O6H91_13G080900 [Diphasiastrum complanatum]|uniref:Uncharacterized protein n=3 Tax=Diphasiastrum complanatum TaxID=34168 RepID=A0ACC2BWK3_DIPCM|nr:hypothetical protein O6H91_13G080900 [Diphasiastrum complanatum]KAJ7534127.1 hypothetical protein O6H91_13G080900 [Diphasiastrum complanatum]KAJ7534128.1 hypothetical protein O6H91_13G080900 [Diphasiastrum complanatum]
MMSLHFSWPGQLFNGKGSSTHSFLKCALVSVFSLAFAQIPVVSAEFHVNTATGRIVDKYGRERLFHGLNVVMKGPPWHPHTDAFDPRNSFCEGDIKLMRKWGMNVVRLAVMWPGVEPTQGNINATYLQIMRSIVRKLHSAGIYTLIEFHQDLFTSQFCGEGVPGWVLGDTVSDHPKSKLYNSQQAFHPSRSLRGLIGRRKKAWGDSTFKSYESAATEALSALERDLDCQQMLRNLSHFPEPLSRRWVRDFDQGTSQELQEKCGSPNWFWFYFSYSVSKAFQDLYENRWGWADLLAGYWKAVVETFKKEKGVLGYELMNEPWAGDFYTDPLLLLPGIADRINLAPFYEKLQAAVRSVDSERIIFFESLTFDDVLCGFSSVPGGEVFKNRSVLSYHYYRPPNLSPRQAFRERLGEGKRLGCGTMLTEFFINREGSSSRWLSKKQHESLSAWDSLCAKWKLCSCSKSVPFCANKMSNNLEQVCFQLQSSERQKLSAEMEAGKDSVEEVLAESDSYVQSWIGWEYKAFLNKTGSNIDQSLFTDDGQVNLNLAKKLARTYPQAVAGKIISFSFDPVFARFSLVYFVERLLHSQAEEENLVSVDVDNSKHCTQIFVHRQFHYPLGLDVKVSDNCLDVKEEERIITICHSNHCLRKVVQVEINRRKP